MDSSFDPRTNPQIFAHPSHYLATMTLNRHMAYRSPVVGSPLSDSSASPFPSPTFSNMPNVPSRLYSDAFEAARRMESAYAQDFGSASSSPWSESHGFMPLSPTVDQPGSPIFAFAPPPLAAANDSSYGISDPAAFSPGARAYQDDGSPAVPQLVGGSYYTPPSTGNPETPYNHTFSLRDTSPQQAQDRSACDPRSLDGHGLPSSFGQEIGTHFTSAFGDLYIKSEESEEDRFEYEFEEYVHFGDDDKKPDFDPDSPRGLGFSPDGLPSPPIVPSQLSSRVRRTVLPIPIPNLTKKSRGRRVPTTPYVIQGGVPKNMRTFVCEANGCGACFQRGEHLKRHVRSIHTNELRE